MEGRWAKLTLCAHLNKYLDITKEIHPIAEELVLRYTEASEYLRIAMLTPMLDESGEHLQYNTAQWINQLRDCILPKVQKSQSIEKHDQSETGTISKIDQWKRLNQKK